MAEVASPLRPYARRFAIEPTKIQIFIGTESAGMVARTISLQRSARRPLHASHRLSRYQGDRGPHGLGFCLHEGCFKTYVLHRFHTARASRRNVCRRELLEPFGLLRRLGCIAARRKESPARSAVRGNSKKGT